MIESARQRQALAVLARGKVHFEHSYELQERKGHSEWWPSTHAVIKSGLLACVSADDTRQERVVSLSASEISWTGGGRVKVRDITGAQPSSFASDRGLGGFSFEISAGERAHHLIASTMIEREQWVDEILKTTGSAQEDKPAFCGADGTVRQAPEEILLPMDPQAQWVWVGEWSRRAWEYQVSTSDWIADEQPAATTRRRQWWCFAQKLTGPALKAVDPQEKDWIFVKRLSRLLADLDKLAADEIPLTSEDVFALQNEAKEKLSGVLAADDERGHAEVSTWFAKKVVTFHTNDPTNVFHMILMIVDDAVLRADKTQLGQLASMLRADVDPLIVERLLPQSRSGPQAVPPKAAAVLKMAQEVHRRFAKVALPTTQHCEEGNLLLVHDLLARLARDPHRWNLSKHEQAFLWEHRRSQFLIEDASLLSKVLLATPDWDADGDEAVELLNVWKEQLSPFEALALLDERFWTSAMDGKACSDPVSRISPFIRHAVAALKGWSDEELSRYMLQLAVVLRTQMHSSELVRFILQRAVAAPATVGHSLYWHVRAEASSCLDTMKSDASGEATDVFARLVMVLRSYLNICPESSRLNLEEQEHKLVRELRIVARDVKLKDMEKPDHSELNDLLRERLAQIDVGDGVALPTAASMTVSAINPAGSFVLRSATKALLLEFQIGDATRKIIFKDGDDLRQDELVLQVFGLMQELWTDDGRTNLQKDSLAIYGVADLGEQVGMIVPVPNAETLARVYLDHVDAVPAAAADEAAVEPVMACKFGCGCGVSPGLTQRSNPFDTCCRECAVAQGSPAQHSPECVARQAALAAPETQQPGAQSMTPRKARIWATVKYNPTVLHDWLVGHCSKTGLAFDSARKNFLHSCAGYCVATYMMGLGDRHASNIMLQPDGHLVHIDFGWWLGHNPRRPEAFRFAMGYNTDYDNDGFAFVPAFAMIIVGKGRFEDENLPWRECEEFRQFVTLCCNCYNVIRERAHDFINLFSVMLAADIGEDDDGHGGGSMKLDADGLKTLRDKFCLEEEEAVAAEMFRRKIETALHKSDALLTNWALNTLGQDRG
jgi:phosphatidylinositol-4,5-bisphosphate 3-kinase